MEKLLTISIAAYNCEKTIAEALESIVSCTNLSSIEVLVIDDGGSDSTLEIARGFSRKYPGIIFPIHKANGGWGSTVNYALNCATGKYFKTLDGDDLFDSAGLDRLVSFLKDCDSDAVFSPYLRFSSSENRVVDCDDTIKNVSQVSAIQDFSAFVMHSLTFKTSLINDVKLLERCFYTDNEYRIKSLNRCTSIAFVNSVVYKYRVGYEGQSVSLIGIEKHYQDSVRVAEELLDYAKRSGNNLTLLGAIDAVNFSLISLIMVNKKADFKLLHRSFKVSFPKYSKKLLPYVKVSALFNYILFGAVRKLLLMRYGH